VITAVYLEKTKLWYLAVKKTDKSNQSVATHFDT